MPKQKVLVVMGGPSQEHEISLKTGQAMYDALDREKYEVSRVTISRNQQWHFDSNEYDLHSALDHIQQEGFTLLLGLHGAFGEDGTIQALCETNAIPYTGSNSAASLLAMDKVVAGELYKKAELKTPKTIVLHQDQFEGHTDSTITMSAIVKPSRQGSSVGVTLAMAPDTIPGAVEAAFQFDTTVLVQEYIKGRELSCGVLEIDGELIALPPTEIIPNHSAFFDFDAKYTKGGSTEITPAQIDDDLMNRIQEAAKAAHQVLSCRTYSRTDVIVRDNDVYVIETNTLPGMTETSILPQQAAAFGMTFAELLDHIIAGAQTAL